MQIRLRKAYTRRETPETRLLWEGDARRKFTPRLLPRTSTRWPHFLPFSAHKTNEFHVRSFRRRNPKRRVARRESG